ncbi:MAG TPA: AAA family ATPase [Dehalococcoidia bacterium]|nr:AAA family ATPase [Dehalococcoidia bacterium]
MASTAALPEFVRALRRKDTYPRPPREIELVQTHISYVFLVDDEVFKVKKPVDLGFVDFTTLAKRRAACEAEVRLNRRGCAGGVYLGVEPIMRDAEGRYRIGGAGEVIDYAVHMKRLPEDRMMDRLLEQDAVDFEMIGRLAGRVAQLHAEAERNDRITRVGGTATLAKNWRDTLEQVRPFVGQTLSQTRYQRIEAFANAFMDSEGELLQRRESDGRIRDCHGDMRSDSVCFDDTLPDGICIYDCIEFNDAFRYCDTGLDIAFLAMDLDYRGRPDLSDLLIGLYAPTAGDPELPLLLNFYKCYRACVRGKVESLLSVDEGVPARQRSRARHRAQAYFCLAAAYARKRLQPGVFLVSGPSGSGKSVLAGALAARLGSALLSTDMLRRQLFDERGRAAEMDAGIYTEESRGRIYAEMLARAQRLAADNRPLVLDATFIERRQREPFENLGRESNRPLLVVECSAPDEVVRARQQRREGEAWSVSEGRWEVYLAQKGRLEPADEVSDAERVAVDTTRDLTEQIEAVEAKLKVG